MIYREVEQAKIEMDGFDYVKMTRFAKNMKKVNRLDWDITNIPLDIVKLRTYDFDTVFEVKEGVLKFRFYEGLISGKWNYSVHIEDIEIYYNGWRHTAPDEMKEYVLKKVEDIVLTFNNYCSENKLDDRYIDYENKKKEEKENKFQDEHKRLNEIFNSFV